MDLKEKAEALLLKNYKLTGKRYIAPDGAFFHIHQWLWDSCFHTISCSELGLKDLAKNEVTRLLGWQREDGWIPHLIYHGPVSKFFDLERRLYKKEHRKFHSSISQPPVLAQAVKAINEPDFTKEVLPALTKFYLYFKEKQDPDNDNLISICHPCEGGRDTSAEFDFFRWRIKRKNFLGFADPILHYFGLFKLEWEYRKLNWDIGKIWQKNLFNVEDLMFNCVWAEGLRILGQNDLADKTEEAIYQLCWDEKDKIFYSLDAKNQKIRRKTISSLFPLILDNIPAKMRQSLVEHLTNKEEFWTEYPIPSLAKNDPEFSPAQGLYCNWQGPVWINMNWFIIKGLIKHGYREIAQEIAEKTYQMIEKEGFREFYNSLTGQGLRWPTRNFSWSTLVITFPKILEEGG